MNDGYKEVYFDQYCKTCRYEKRSEDKDPCFDCLNEPVNVYSHKQKMTDKQRMRNCNKCRTRRIQFLFQGWIFDFRNCPYVCTQNKLYDKLKKRGAR